MQTAEFYTVCKRRIMTLNKQKTLAGEYKFYGKGLHTGRISTMILKPAPENTGIVFHRVDLGESAFVEALAGNVSSTARSTTISKGETAVATIEHIMSALTGMGVDNALIEIDNVEVPILDGSALLCRGHRQGRSEGTGSGEKVCDRP